MPRNNLTPPLPYVLAWKVDPHTKALLSMRLLSVNEFFDDPRNEDFCWSAYVPAGIDTPVSDGAFTREVDTYGLEAAIFDRLSNLCGLIPAGILQRLQVDLRRFRINGWNLDADTAFDRAHWDMINEAEYVEDAA